MLIYSVLTRCCGSFCRGCIICLKKITNFAFVKKHMADSDNYDIEARLIRRLKSGDVEAFASVYKLYFQRLYVYCRQFTKSAYDAEDIVQEVFTKIWSNRDSIIAESTLRGLLFTIARNYLISAYRRNINAPVYEDYLDYCNSIGREDTSAIEYAEFASRVEYIIDSLPPAQARVVRMSKLEHLSNKEISISLGINEQSVKNHLSKGMKYVRSHLSRLLIVILAVIMSGRL